MIYSAPLGNAGIAFFFYSSQNSTEKKNLSRCQRLHLTDAETDTNTLIHIAEIKIIRSTLKCFHI